MERNPAMAYPTEVDSAHAHFFNGTKLFVARNRKSVREAKNEFLKAIELDPNFARAYSWLAYVTLEEYLEGWDDDVEGGITPAAKAAERGVSLDDNDYFTHWVMATIRLAQKNHSEARDEYKKALDQLDSDKADVLAEKADVFSYEGNTDEAIKLINEANSLDPKSPKEWYFWSLGFAYFQQGDYVNAVSALKELKDPSNGAYLLLVTSQAKMGEKVPIDEIIARLRRKDPDWKPDYFDRYPFAQGVAEGQWIKCLNDIGIKFP
jgi:adenylate cyclase